jgi:hypothetical protein
MDFVHDALMDPEDRTRYVGKCGAAVLDKAIAKQGKPQTITVDHGTEFTSHALN